MGTLTSAVTATGDTAFVKFSGTLDEDSNFNASLFPEYKSVTFDLKDIERVTSKGVRAWMLWTARLDNTKAFVVQQVSRVFVTQANIIPGLIPHWMKVKSVELPYYCAACGNAFGRVLELKDGQIPTDVEVKVNCDSCPEKAEFDAIVERYFQFLKTRTVRK